LWRILLIIWQKHFPMQPIEYEILIAASHINPDEDQLAHLRKLLARDYDQDRLIQLAKYEGMTGLLYKSLKKAGILGFFGHQQMQQLQSFYYRTIQCNLQIVHDLKEILRRSNEKEVQVVLLQGVALLEKIYEDIGLRPLTDIDLWVLPEKRGVFDALMAQLGFQRDRLYPNTFKKGKTIVDINSHILWADRIRSRRHLLAKSQHTLYDSIEILNFDGEPAGWLDGLDQVLYLSLHAFKHRASRLIWLVDLKHLITGWQASNWQALFDRAGEWGQVSIVYDMLYLMRHLFELKLPPDVQAMVENRNFSWLEQVILQKRLNGRPLPDWAPLLLFTSGKDFMARLSFVFETLFPRPTVLRQIFCARADFRTWQLYLKRALQLVGMVKSNKSV
jgi:hypothetical protein